MVIQPSSTLKKMLQMVKILCLINILCIVGRIWTRPWDMFYDIFCIMFLFMGYNTGLFLHFAIYCIMALISCFYLFIDIGTYIQWMLFGNPMNGTMIAFLVISIVIFMFYMTAIILIFPVYKETKIQMMGLGTGDSPAVVMNRGNGGGYVDESLPGQTQMNRGISAQQGAFRAFAGRGVALG
jgi:hypothetical protein